MTGLRRLRRAREAYRSHKSIEAATRGVMMALEGAGHVMDMAEAGQLAKAMHDPEARGTIVAGLRSAREFSAQNVELFDAALARLEELEAEQ